MTDPSPRNGFYQCCGSRAEYPAILAEDVPLVVDTNRTLTDNWWHSSDEADLVLHGPIHLGSRRAAEDRSVRTLDHAREIGISATRYLHRITLREDASIAPHVMIEIVGSDHTHALRLLEEWDVVRYVNRTEAPGSVSLLASSSAVSAIRVESSTRS